MGVITTPNLYKSLTFDGASSRTYGVFITGEAVYNAPQRAVEMISIPGRNGAFALDQGRFENIEVSYPAGIFADNEEDFAEAISDFRNYLCSREGYCRLTDDYNADEYRLAIYKSGLEVDPAQLKAGEFNIVFECKPQRFLTSGETAVSVTSGDDITNPTLFNSSPLIKATGYGNLTIGDSGTIIVNSLGPIGKIKGADSATISGTYTLTVNIKQFGAAGDSMYFYNNGFGVTAINISDIWIKPTGFTFDTVDYVYSNNLYVDVRHGINDNEYITIYYDDEYFLPTFTYGTAHTYSETVTLKYKENSLVVAQGTIGFSLAYDGANTLTLLVSKTLPNSWSSFPADLTLSTNSLYIDSTLPSSGLVYIDTDIGEAYTINSGDVISLNNYVSLPTELPILKPGTNTITYSNTFTQFEVMPRWWKV